MGLFNGVHGSPQDFLKASGMSTPPPPICNLASPSLFIVTVNNYELVHFLN